MTGLLTFSFLTISNAAVIAAGLNMTVIYKLAGVAVIVFIIFAIAYIKRRFRSKIGGGSFRNSLFSTKKLVLTLEKNRVYFPDFIYMHIRNTGKTEVDIERPIVIFSNFWIQRKFRLKGTNLYHFYPLYLAPGEAHDLTLDIQRFYTYDRRLKKFPKVTVYIRDVKGRTLARKNIMLRKTLFT